jgi:beta-phosphoglucomutase
MRGVRPETVFLFDMDGVIIDSTAIHIEAWQRYLAGHGIHLDDIGSRMLGKHNDQIVREFFANDPLKESDIIDHGLRKERMYRDLMAPEFDRQLVPGIKEFLRAHEDTAMALATNAESANVEFVLGRAGLRQYFRAIVNGHDVERPKPAPDVYLKAACLLGAAPENCIVFEDSSTGIAAGIAAGMRVVAVATTISEFSGVDLIISDFRDCRLQQWLQASCLPV